MRLSTTKGKTMVTQMAFPDTSAVTADIVSAVRCRTRLTKKEFKSGQKKMAKSIVLQQ